MARWIAIVALTLALAVGGLAFVSAQDATPATNALGTPCGELMATPQASPMASPEAGMMGTPEASPIAMLGCATPTS